MHAGAVLVVLVLFVGVLHAACPVPKTASASECNDAGEALFVKGDYAGAAACFKRVVKLLPKSTVGHTNLAECYVHMKELDKAEDILQQAVRDAPPDDEVYFKWGTVLQEQGESQAAIEKFEECLQLNPDRADVYTRLSQIVFEAGDENAAIEKLIKARDIHLKQKTVSTSSWNVFTSLGNVLKKVGRYDEAIDAYKQAIKVDSKKAIPYEGLAHIFSQRETPQDYRKALNYFLQASKLTATPSTTILYNIGHMRQQLGEYDEAIKDFKGVLKHEKQHFGALVSLGYVYGEQENFGTAAKYYIKALKAFPVLPENPIDPMEFEILRSLNATARQRVKLTLGNLVRCLQRVAEWDNMAHYVKQLKGLIEWQIIVHDTEPTEINPWAVVSFPIPLPLANYVAVQSASKLIRPAYEVALFNPTIFNEANEETKHGHFKLKVGYASSSLKQHPLGIILHKIFALHDRSRIEVYVYHFGSTPQSYWTDYINEHADHITSLSDLNDYDAAKKIAEDGIHVLLNLDGHTVGERSVIFSYEPAPVQIVGFGDYSLFGAPFIKYQLTDPVCTPKEFAGSEYTSYLFAKNCHFFFSKPNEDELPIQEKRNEYKSLAGFPAIVKEDTFIFCNFGKYFKVTPEMFEVWMKILTAVPNSVLWLLRYPHESPDDAISNLKAKATNHGVDSNRIIFTPLFEFKDHFKVKSVADLYLDTSPYNSHTTLAEALWAGIPAISFPMDSIVSRTGASMLNASGLEDLIADSYNHYQQLAIELANDRSKLTHYRNSLFGHRKDETKPFFNNLQWVRDWEDVLWGVWEKELTKKTEFAHTHNVVGTDLYEENGDIGTGSTYTTEQTQHDSAPSQGIYFGENADYKTVECDGFVC